MRGGLLAAPHTCATLSRLLANASASGAAVVQGTGPVSITCSASITAQAGAFTGDESKPTVLRRAELPSRWWRAGAGAL